MSQPGTGAAVVQRLPAAYKRLTDRIADVEADADKTFGIGALAGHLRSLQAMKDVAERSSGFKRGDELDKERKEVSDYMAAHSKAVGPGAKLAPWAHLGLTFSWEIRLHAYLGDQNPPGELLQGNTADTPWARKDQLLQPLD